MWSLAVEVLIGRRRNPEIRNIQSGAVDQHGNSCVKLSADEKRECDVSLPVNSQ